MHFSLCFDVLVISCLFFNNLIIYFVKCDFSRCGCFSLPRQLTFFLLYLTQIRFRFFSTYLVIWLNFVICWLVWLTTYHIWPRSSCPWCYVSCSRRNSCCFIFKPHQWNCDNCIYILRCILFLEENTFHDYWILFSLAHLCSFDQKCEVIADQEPSGSSYN